ACADLTIVGEAPEDRALPGWHGERFAVDEKPVSKIEELGLRVQLYMVFFRRTLAENNLRFRRRQVPPQKIFDVLAFPANLSKKPGGKTDHARIDLRSSRGRLETGIAIAGIRQAALVQVVEEGSAELRAAWRAKADRAGEALIERNAVVAPTRR